MGMLADARTEATVPSRDLERAAEFYGNVLGLRSGGSLAPRTDLLYELGAGSTLLVYDWPGSPPPPPALTFAHFLVDDVHATVHELRGRGVVFDEYDLPELKTVDGVAEVGDHRFAWFHDPDGNVLGIRD
jgi:catechol 2,3-dioxygenase-like lactoylglutathione lyase family enzyme